MTRYFPEVVAAVLASFPSAASSTARSSSPTRTSGLDFEALQQRIHPAASRVDLLAEQTPASFVAFDLLALGDDDLTGSRSPSGARCSRSARPTPKPPVHVTPATTRPRRSPARWFDGSRAPGSTASSPSRST